MLVGAGFSYSGTVRMGILDTLIEAAWPAWAESRAQSRMWTRHYDETRRNIQASYRGATSTRVDQTWIDSYSSSGLRHLRKAKLGKMRDRARQLDRDNILAGAILDRSTENVVSTGFTLRPKTPDADFNSRASDKFARYAETCEIRGLFSLDECTALAWRAANRDGDVGVQLLEDGGIQLLEGDFIESPNEKTSLPSGHGIDEGVQVNESNTPVAYWVKSKRNGRTSHAPIDADAFIYLPRMNRINQVRGEPVFAPLFPLFDQIDGYMEAEVIAARMAANFGLFWKSKGRKLAGMTKQDDSQGTARPILWSEPGTIVDGSEDDEITQIKPEHPHQQFDAFLSTLVRFTGLKLGLPLELSMLNFTQANYAQSRGVLLQAQRTFRCQQRWLNERFLRRLYRWRISKWIKGGDLDPPNPRTDQFANPTEWMHQWRPPGWKWLDPVKELQGIGLALDMDITTLEAEIAKLGEGGWEETVLQRALETRRQRESGRVPVKMNQTRDDTASGSDDGPADDQETV